MRGWILAAVLLVMPLSAWAAEPPPAPTAEAIALARQVIDATGGATDFHNRMRGLMDPIMRSATSSLPAAQKAQALARFDLMQKAVEADMPLFLDAAARTYATTYTTQELADLLTFYQSPLGRTLIAEQSLLVANTGKATASLIPKMMHDVLVQLCSQTTCTPQTKKQIEALAGI